MDAAKGCIIGAFVGDAAGAVLEFYNSEIKENNVEDALTFSGGGVIDVSYFYLNLLYNNLLFNKIGLFDSIFY